MSKQPQDPCTGLVDATGAQAAPAADHRAHANRDAAHACLTRVGLFWSADWSADPAAPFYGTGARVAAGAWTRALLRYGNISAVDIFTALSDVASSRATLVSGMLTDGDGPSTPTTSVVAESDLPSRFREHAYSVLHDPSTDLTASSYARARFARGVLPVTCSQHAISYSNQLYALLIRLFTAQIYPCDAIVCLTKASRQAMGKRMAQVADQYSTLWGRAAPLLPRLELIPWGVDTDLFKPQDQVTARRALGLPTARPIVLCLGRLRLEDKMDLTPLLLAFQEVCRGARQRPLLVIAGAAASDYPDQLLSNAVSLNLQDDIRTYFDCPSVCLPYLYSACDVFVSPTDSPSESFGLTIIEAMACGRPVIASDWDGYRDLIDHGVTGFRARTDWADCLGEVNEAAPVLTKNQDHLHVGQSVSVDVRQMTTFLAQLVNNADLRAEMGDRARVQATELFGWPVVIAQWEELWRELGSIARTVTKDSCDLLGYLQPNHFQHFSHYASRIVDFTTPIALTVRGKEALAGRAPILLHPLASGFLSVENLHAALAVLKPAGWLGISASLGDMVRVLQKKRLLTREQAVMHIMWLAKYDLVALGSGSTTAS